LTVEADRGAARSLAQSAFLIRTFCEAAEKPLPSVIKPTDGPPAAKQRTSRQLTTEPTDNETTAPGIATSTK
jgi:hypothetical protein